MVNKQGRILNVLSGRTFGNAQSVLPNTVYCQDEVKVMAALEKGDVEAARKLIMDLAPPYDPDAVDERGRKLPVPKYSLEHLRARAHVYIALEEWDKALADAEAVVAKHLGEAGGMSLRTPELDEAEALRDAIKAKKEAAGK